MSLHTPHKKLTSQAVEGGRRQDDGLRWVVSRWEVEEETVRGEAVDGGGRQGRGRGRWREADLERG